MQAPSIIGLDADDRLWHNETLFRMTQARFHGLLAPWADAARVESALAAVERRNLGLFGYGAKGFTLSMLETALELSDATVLATLLADILASGRTLMAHPIEPLWAHEAAQAPVEHPRFGQCASLAEMANWVTGLA